MSGMLGLGGWWGNQGAASGQQGQTANPLVNYSDRMRAAGMGGTMGTPPAQSPLVAAYTPPAYQTTPPHVDIDAVIAAMNQMNQAQPQAPAMPTGIPGMMPGEGAANGLGAEPEAGGMSADRGDITSEARGFLAGGYTGNAPITQPVGMVHGQEEVINAPATKAVGRKTLDKINEGDPKAVATAAKIAERVPAKKGDDQNDSAEIAKEVTRRVAARHDGPKKDKK